MKNLAKLIGFIAIVAVIGFGIISCDDGPGDPPDLFKGTWGSDGNNQIVAANGEFIQYQPSEEGGELKPYLKGTYTVSGDTVTITFTHIDQNQDGTWAPYTPPDENHPPVTVYGTISGGVLTVTVNGQQYEYTKEPSGTGGPDGPGGPGEGSSGGTFILSDIPQEHWGKYAIVYGDEIMMIGAADIVAATQTVTGALISNGSVTLPMWILTSQTSVGRYSGSDTDDVYFLIFSGSPIYSGNEDVEVLFEGVTFNSGNATRTWSDGSSSDPGGPGEGSSGGTFILSDIPQEHWGKYAIVYGDEIMMIGAADIVAATQTVTGALISNGSVTLPMWILTSQTSVGRYSGSDTDDVYFLIFSGSPIYSGNEEVEVLFEGVTFNNGSATRTWSDGSSSDPGGPGEGNP